MMMNDDEYALHIVDYSDTTIRGATAIDENGFPTIYINARHNAEQQLKTMTHELTHIICDDFFNDDDLDCVRARLG